MACKTHRRYKAYRKPTANCKPCRSMYASVQRAERDDRLVRDREGCPMLKQYSGFNQSLIHYVRL